MKCFVIGFCVGLVVVGILLGVVQTYDERTLKVCKDAEVNSLPIIWQKDRPFCTIDITINDKVKNIPLSDYYEYIKQFLNEISISWGKQVQITLFMIQ